MSKEEIVAVEAFVAPDFGAHEFGRVGLGVRQPVTSQVFRVSEPPFALCHSTFEGAGRRIVSLGVLPGEVSQQESQH